MSTRQLTYEECKKYVGIIYQLELSCYQQQKLNNRLKERYKLIAEKAKMPEEKFGDRSVADWMGEMIGAILVWSILLIGIFAICTFGWGIIQELYYNFWVERKNIEVLENTITSALIGLLLGIVVGAITTLIDFLNEEKYKEARAIRLQEERYTAMQYQQKLPKAYQICTTGDQQLAQTKNLLNQYYALGYIHPKYRDLATIGTMYEYLVSGRCFSLVGPYGAYNLYEYEKKQNIIIGKLDDIIDRLDRIQDSQYMLASAIQNSNVQIEQLSRTLNNIENNTALSTYYNSVTASNTEYFRWLSMYR